MLLLAHFIIILSKYIKLKQYPLLFTVNSIAVSNITMRVTHNLVGVSKAKITDKAFLTRIN